MTFVVLNEQRVVISFNRVKGKGEDGLLMADINRYRSIVNGRAQVGIF